MIPIEVQKRTVEKINGREGRKYPISNQIVKNILWLDQPDDRFFNFIKERSTSDFLKKRKNTYDGAEIEIDGIIYIIKKTYEHSRGYRSYRAIIDSHISEDAFRTLVYPSMGLYCCQVEFF